MSVGIYNTINSEAVAKMSDASIRSVQNPNNRCHKYYLGNGLFVRSEIEELKYQDEAEEWFKAEIGLFIEYLNKVEHISYSDIARKSNSAIPSVSALKVSIKMGARILVKFRAYIKAFENYYKG